MHFQTFDAEYVQRLTEGDSMTEEHFASYFGELLFLKLRSRLRSRQLIEDIRQETLLRVLQILRKRKGVEHPERFGAFVNSVGNNVMMEYCRFESRHDAIEERQDDPADDAVNLDGPLIHSDIQRIIRRVMDELSEKDRILLREVYLEELDKAEICRKHKVDPDYLRVLLHRAKSRFKKIYIEQGGNAPFSLGVT